MPSFLALILCLAFVYVLLRLEHRQIPDVRRSLWIPTIWMIYVASKPLAAWFPSSGATPESSPLDRAFLIALILIALGTLFRRRVDWPQLFVQNAWLMLLVAFMLVSILWSKIPGTSFNRWIREVLAVLMAFIVFSEPSPRRAMESILRRTTFILIPFSLLLVKYYPAYGVAYGQWSGIQMWIGVALQKNSLVSLGVISGFFLLWSLIRRRQGHDPAVWKYQTWLEILVLSMTLVLMGGPNREVFYSATSIFALSAGLLVYGGLHLAKKLNPPLGPQIVTISVAVIVIFGIVSLFLSGSILGSVASYAGRDQTLTGRTEVWAQLLPVAMRNPIAGSGFGGFWTPRTRAIYNISGAHSGYLDTLLGLGFTGLFLVLMFLTGSSRKAQYVLSKDYDWGILCICYIVIVALHNFSESSVDSLTNHLTAVILFLSVSNSNQKTSRAPSLDVPPPRP